MKVTQGKQPIFWLVRLLGAIGLVMAVVMIGQTGLQLRIAGTRLVALTSPGRTSTEELTGQHRHLSDQAGQTIAAL
jgi:hypothetical protein